MEDHMNRKLISFDWAIKKILRNKANFGILEGFLSELLFTDITILELLESESDKQDESNKSSRVDIKVKDADNKIFIIEVQYSREMDFMHRILFGTSKAISEHLREGRTYADIVKVISVNILYFDLGQGDDYIYHGTTSFIGLHNRSVLQLNEVQKRMYRIETVSDIYPEYYLIELKKFKDVARDTLDEWIYFFKNGEIKTHFHAKGLREAQEKLDVLTMNPAEKRAYDTYHERLHYEASMYESTYIAGRIEGRIEGMKEGMEEGLKEGMKEGMEKGMETGMEKGILMLAKKMKQEGMPAQTISKITGFSVEEIEALFC
jgi:predicted transposase/invertase (TIGR01784 family)